MQSSRVFEWTGILSVAVALLASGCAPSLGGTYHRTVDGPPEDHAAGVRVGGMSKLLNRDQGVAVGLDMEAAWRAGKSPLLAPELGGFRVLAGWASTPLPYRSCPVGVEVLATTGLGRHSYGDHVVRGLSFGPRIGVPIRLGSRTRMWDSEEKLGMTPVVVPTLDWSWIRPTDKGEHALGYEVIAGLSIRYELWSALLP